MYAGSSHRGLHGAVLSASGAYAFARLRWQGRDVVFGVLLTALMVPSVFTLLPNFVL